MLSSLKSDIRHAIRALAASPWFTAVAILSLSIGVCVSSGIVAIVDASHGRNTPFRNVDRAVALSRDDVQHEAGRFWGLPLASLNRARLESRTINSLAVWAPTQLTLRTDEWATVVSVAEVSAALPRVLGVRGVIGRTFIEADEQSGSPAAVMITHSYWRKRFASDSGIVGRTVMLDGKPHLVIGVLEARAHFPSYADIWRLRPLAEVLADTTAFLSAIALLEPGATAASATAELRTLGAMSATSRSKKRALHPLSAAPLADFLSVESSGALLFLTMIGIVVGLIAATNFAALVLARGIRRRAELAIRAALGASTARLVGFMVFECLLVALCGGALGGLLSPFVVNTMGAAFAGMLPAWMQLTFSLAAVLSAIALALVVGLVFGLAPALELARPAALGVMRGSAIATQRQRSGRQLLVAVQVALATGPIVFASLLFGGLFQLEKPSLGYDQRNLYQGTVQGGERDAAWRRPQERAALIEAVRRAPNVASVAVSNTAYMQSVDLTATTASGQTVLSDRGAELHEVTPEFFRTYSPALVAGRLPTDEEIAHGDPVAVVSEATFRALSLPRGLGWQLRLFRSSTVTVVGIVADVRDRSLAQNAIAQVYVPLSPTATLRGYSETLWLRATPGATRVASGVFDAIHYSAGMAPLADLQSSIAVSTNANKELRSVVSITLSIFAVALVLASMGIYGTIAYAAVMRKKEVAVRLALGASRTHVAGVVMKEAAVQAVIGLFFGLAGGDLAATLMPGAVTKFSLPPIDVVALATFSFAAVLVFASLVPVRRVWATDCAATLREDG